jgi:hypothetical protein
MGSLMAGQLLSKDNEPLMTLASKSIRIFLLVCHDRHWNDMREFFQGIGKPGRSLILNMSRQF